MHGDDGKRAIFITGGGSGIGRATAQLFAAKGWLVGKTARRLKVATTSAPGLLPRRFKAKD